MTATYEVNTVCFRGEEAKGRGKGDVGGRESGSGGHAQCWPIVGVTGLSIYRHGAA